MHMKTHSDLSFSTIYKTSYNIGLLWQFCHKTEFSRYRLVGRTHACSTAGIFRPPRDRLDCVGCSLLRAPRPRRDPPQARSSCSNCSSSRRPRPREWAQRGERRCMPLVPCWLAGSWPSPGTPGPLRRTPSRRFLEVRPLRGRSFWWLPRRGYLR